MDSGRLYRGLKFHARRRIEKMCLYRARLCVFVSLERVRASVLRRGEQSRTSVPKRAHLVPAATKTEELRTVTCGIILNFDWGLTLSELMRATSRFQLISNAKPRSKSNNYSISLESTQEMKLLYKPRNYFALVCEQPRITSARTFPNRLCRRRGRSNCSLSVIEPRNVPQIEANFKLKAKTALTW